MDGLYRYQSKHHNDGLLNKGNLRVGTLYGFRKSEHKRGIADALEGQKRVFHRMKSFCSNYFDPVGRQALRDFGVANVDGVKDFRVSNITFERIIEVRDCFIFCMSSELSLSMYQYFEGAESCVFIENPRSFFWRLTYSINQITAVEFKGLFPVVYTDEAEPWNCTSWGEAPVNRKTSEFCAQREVRAVWMPKNDGEITPIIVNDKKLRRYVQGCL